MEEGTRRLAVAAGALIFLSSLLVLLSWAVDFGFNSPWKWPAAAILAAVSLVSAWFYLERAGKPAGIFMFPLNIALLACVAVFTGLQFLTDIGAINQTADPNALRAASKQLLPLMLWSIALGLLRLKSDRFFAPPGADQRPGAGRLLLAPIIIAGALTRFWNLGALGLWSDEGTVFVAVKGILSTGLPSLETGLLYLRDLPHLYVTAASIALFGPDEFGLRFPSALAGTLLIPIIYFLTLKLFNRQMPALAAASLVALHPWLIEYSRFGRSYMMMLLLVYAAAYFWQNGAESAGAKSALAISGFLAALTHQVGQAVFFLGAVSLTRADWRRRAVNFWPFLVILLGIVCFKVFFAFGYYYEADAMSGLSSSGALARRLPFSLPSPENLLIFLRVVPLFFLAAAVFGAGRRHLAGSVSGQSARLWLIIFMAALLFSKKEVSLNRGIIFVFPLLAIAAASLLDHWWRRVEQPAVRAGLIGTAVMVLVFYAGFNLFNFTQRDYGSAVNPNHAPFDGFTFYHDNKTPIEFVDRHRRPGDKVVVMGLPQFWAAYSDFRPDWRVWTGNSMLYRGRNIFIGTPEVRSLADLVGILKRHERVWIVTSYSVVSTTRIQHINGEISTFLGTLKEDLKYQSRDKTTAVYLVQE